MYLTIHKLLVHDLKKKGMIYHKDRAVLRMINMIAKNFQEIKMDKIKTLLYSLYKSYSGNVIVL